MIFGTFSNTYWLSEGDSLVKNPPANAEDTIWSLGWEERFPRTGNGNPFHGLWSQTWLSMHRCTIDLLCVFFGERSIQILYPFFKLSFFFSLLSFRSSLYILDINPLSHIWFANTFFNFLGCLFILLIISFTIQTF